MDGLLTNKGIRNRTCQECGMLLDDPGEFHPFVFCVLKKAGRDPWLDLTSAMDALGVDTSHLPERPPLVRHLPVSGPSGRG